MKQPSDLSAAEIAAARARLPQAFAASPRESALKAIAWFIFAALVLYALIDFNFSPTRLWEGLGKLGFVLGFMLPPYVWPTWGLFMEPVTAIGETLAMAFLGTLLAGLAALPLSFLGAKNILRVPWMRFGVRRGFDGYALRMQGANRLRCGFLDGVGDGDQPGRLAVRRDEHRRLALGAQGFGALRKRIDRDAEGVHQRPIAERHRLRADAPSRAFEQLVLDLLFIRAFGLGPLAGIFAIALSDIGVLAKLFSEAIENIDQKQVEGVRASGGGPLQVIRLAILPQVLPVMLSNALYQLESNTRSATILGIVGAGGIGFLLYDRIAANNWDEVMSIVLLILVTVYGIDSFSGWLRGRIIGKNDYRP